MSSRSLFIVYRNPLFAQGLRALLSGVPGLEVVGIGLGDVGEHEVWNDIRELEPDVILLEEEENTPVSRALNAAPGSQLVALSLTHKEVKVYAHRVIEGGGLEAVVQAIAQIPQAGLDEG